MKFIEFAAKVRDAYNKLPHVKKHVDKKKPSVNQIFTIPSDPLPSDPELVIAKCQQIAAVAAAKGNVSEPHWYATLGVLHFCTSGDTVAHRISSGHPNYSAEQTVAKLSQFDGFGPTLCTTFADKNPGGCEGCPHRGIINSPISLGVTVAALPIHANPKNIEPPEPYKRTELGIVVTRDEIDLPVYPYDIYVTEVARDAQGGYDVILVKHVLPVEGEQEFAMRASDSVDKKLFNKVCSDNAVAPSEELRMYMQAYRHHFHTQKERRLMHSSMGWKENSFVLGQQEFCVDGTVRDILVAPSIRPLAQAIHTKGDSTAWSLATAILGQPGMEAHAFMLGLAFASPLMRFASIEGCMFSAIGDTGTGKTLMGRFLNSAFGDWHGLWLKKQDTENSKVQFFGAMGSLTVYTDEITNISPEILSEFVYEATSGRSKRRLKESGDPRSTLTWNLITACSSNSSVVDKLRSIKTNPDAELARIFEFIVPHTTSLTGSVGKTLSEVISNNYGHAGRAYVQYVVTNQEAVKTAVSNMIELIRTRTGSPPEERFLISGVACVIVGLKIAELLGLVRFDHKPIAKWAIEYIRDHRRFMGAIRNTPLDLLGAYLNENRGSCITVEKQQFKHSDDTVYNVKIAPSQAIYARYDYTAKKLWVEVMHFNTWLQERQERFGEVRSTLMKDGVLKQIVRKTLGYGTGYATSQVTCMEFDMNHPLMGHNTVQLVTASATTLAPQRAA